ncbi:STAS domain-containing protein [Kitasatospora sp. NPDC057223]|uniref:STAS domain-containing protein n=1 Tax=Kitasatospora sp. NPDC057223 TaxID=3346055 RepID=UPI003641B46A
MRPVPYGHHVHRTGILRSCPITNTEPGPALTVTALVGPAGSVLECAGAIDADTVPVLSTAVHRALTSPPAPPLLVIDLGAVTFCDSSGLSTLLRTRLEAARQGTELHLARPTQVVLRILEITGADQVFTIDQDVPAACAVPPARPGG